MIGRERKSHAISHVEFLSVVLAEPLCFPSPVLQDPFVPQGMAA
jgi:hypothetical protein